MAPKKAAAAPTAAAPVDVTKLDPEAQYRITVSRIVSAGKVKLKPDHDSIVVKGKVATAIADAIKTIEKV